MGAGGGFFSPIPIHFAPSSLFLSPASTRRGRAPADLCLRGAPLHFLWWSRSPPRSLAMDAGIAPFPLSSCLDFKSSILGAIVVASLDFWLNLGLSRMEKATRRFGLVIGRSIFEFCIPVVPDLSTAVGNRRSPAWSRTTARAVQPLHDHGTTAGYPHPSNSYQISIHVVFVVGLCSFFRVVSSARVFSSR